MILKRGVFSELARLRFDSPYTRVSCHYGLNEHPSAAQDLCRKASAVLCPQLVRLPDGRAFVYQTKDPGFEFRLS